VSVRISIGVWITIRVRETEALGFGLMLGLGFGLMLGLGFGLMLGLKARISVQ
jgi:hypothetical protein